MENKNDLHEDQAAQLKNLFNEVQKNEIDALMDTDDTPKERRPDKIDVLNLPPRREIHGKSKQRIKLKINKPFRRLLIVILILALFTFGYVWGEELIYLMNNR